LAIEDKYVDSQLALDTPTHALLSGGAAEKVICLNFEVAAADDNASLYRVAKGISSDRRLVQAEMVNDAMTSSSDWDFGVYKGLDDGGAVIVKDCFANGVSNTSARAMGSAISLLSAMDQNEWSDEIYKVAGETEGARTFKVDLVLTANAVGSAAGTIGILIEFA